MAEPVGIGATSASEAMYSALLGALPIPVAIIGSGGVLLANDAAAAFFGMSGPNDLIGFQPEQFVTQDSSDIRDRFQHFAEYGEAPDEFQVVVHAPSGPRTMEVHRRVIEFGGELVEVAAAIDVTDRVAAEARLAESAELHRFLADNASELLMKASIDGVVMYASQDTGSMLEMDSGDLVGANLLDVTHPDDRQILAALFEDARNTGATVDADVRISTAAAGHYPWINVRAHCVVVADDSLELHVSMRDIRQRRAAELALVRCENTRC